MALATADEYLSALEKSKLLVAGQLAQAQSLAAASSTADALARTLARENLLTRWQAGTLLALGTRAQLHLGKYKLIERLGKGGMGTVFLAEHVTMNRRVALKIVPRSIAEDRHSLDRFFAEARAIAALDHPNIVQAYSVDNEMDRYFIVMEYIDGEDLQWVVETEGRMEFERAADYIRQAAEGLAHAHTRNLVHCDVKPSNLMLNPQGVIKILDLGLARLNQSDEANGSGEQTLGTVDYMAPEQGLGSANFDHRADIYSLGCTLHFLLTGHPPFLDGTLAQRIVKHQTQQPRDILLERPDTPLRLVEICRRMMAKQPEERYQSMHEVHAELAPLCGANDQAGMPAPRAVKPIQLQKTVPNGNGAAEDWLLAITRQASASAACSSDDLPDGSSSSMHSHRMSGRQGSKRRSTGSRAIAASSAGGLGTLLAWFRTPQRMIFGAIGGMAACAAIVVLTALSLQSSPPPSHPKLPLQAQAPNKAKPLEDEVARPNESAPDKKPVSSSTEPKAKSSAAKTGVEDPHAHAAKRETSENQKLVQPSVNPPVTPDALETTKPVVKPVVRPDTTSAPGLSQLSSSAEKPVERAKEVALDELLAAVDLPTIRDSSVALSLGKLESALKIDLEIQLLGGETIAKGNPKFELLKESDGDKPAWFVVMAEKGKDDVKVARIYRDGGECKFQWTNDARERSSLVRYCGLQFASGKERHFTALISPKSIPPLVFDLDAALNRPRRISREFALPDASLLHMQILPLDKTVPNYEIKVIDKGHSVHAPRSKTPEITLGDTIAPKGRALVVVSKQKTPQVAFQVTFDAHAKEATFSLDATCDAAGETMPFNTSEIQRRAAGVARILMMAEGPQRNPRNAPSQLMVQAAKAASNDFKALDTLVVELHRQVAVPFCIYVVAGLPDDNRAPRIVIFQGDEDDSLKVTEPRKSNKGNRSKGRGPLDAGT